MRIFEAIPFAFLAAALAGGPASALDANPPAPGKSVGGPPGVFRSVKDAFQTGIKDYNAGDKAGAARALEFAAQQGHALARWKLGRMYADGDGVPRDLLKAFDYFSQIVDEEADNPPDSPNARFVASAFVALGSFFLDGISGTYVRPNAVRAREMYQHAASYFGDPDAQYFLARLYLGGLGGPKDSRQALRWLNLAAEKNQIAAQALLGKLLFSGEAGLRQRARGLMWLTLARDAADPARDAWILDLYASTLASAAEEDRQAALVFLEDHARRRP